MELKETKKKSKKKQIEAKKSKMNNIEAKRSKWKFSIEAKRSKRKFYRKSTEVLLLQTTIKWLFSHPVKKIGEI